MKKYFIAIFILLGLAVIYHFYAANSAETDLDEAIQKITVQSKMNLNISYSSIDVRPFSGDIIFSDINIIRDDNIQRAAAARFDLAYRDFLNFTFWDTEYGLKNINEGILILKNPSYTNRTSLLEVKLDSLHMDYRGNLWNLIVLALSRSPAQTNHKIEATGSNFSLSQPDSGFGTFKADSLELDTRFGKQPDYPDSLASSVSLKKITWSPPVSFQKRYGFFIQGFGFQTDSIPVNRAVLRYRYDIASDSLVIKHINLTTELFTAQARGGLKVNTHSFTQSELHNLSVRLINSSLRFLNFLDQLQKITGIQLSGGSKQIQFYLNGPLEKPQVMFQE